MFATIVSTVAMCASFVSCSIPRVHGSRVPGQGTPAEISLHQGLDWRLQRPPVTV